MQIRNLPFFLGATMIGENQVVWSNTLMNQVASSLSKSCLHTLMHIKVDQKQHMRSP
jgi:hypothetical protein